MSALVQAKKKETTVSSGLVSGLLQSPAHPFSYVKLLIQVSLFLSLSLLLRLFAIAFKTKQNKKYIYLVRLDMNLWHRLGRRICSAESNTFTRTHLHTVTILKQKLLFVK